MIKGGCTNSMKIMKTKSDNPVLLIDLYELTMAASYYEHKRFSQSTFSLFIRNYPLYRSYFVSAGLADAVEFLANCHFTADDIAYLDTTGLFTDEFLHYLHSLRFTGDLFAMREGRLFFNVDAVRTYDRVAERFRKR